MPAKHIIRIDKGESYSHVYNRGVSEKTIFNDEQDYEIFLSYLKDYLTPPTSPEKSKKTFTVKGRTFSGVPHQPKNYFNNISLIAYNLMPNHFHLLLHQTTKGSLENFMRSLCTRYSMYFNKRYQRTGSLFEGPYKSVHVVGVSPLLHLTRYLHSCPEANNKHLIDKYSSYADYLGKRQTSWVKPDVVLSYFNNSENKAFKGIGGYKNFVEKYELTQDDEKLLEGIILEKEYEPLERSDSGLERNNLPDETPLYSDLKPVSRFPEIAVTTIVFVLLFALGYRNILVTSAKNISYAPLPSPTPIVAGIKDEQSKITLVVKINDDSASINIRQGPTIDSDKIGEAKNGEVFEFVSINSGWFGVKLADGSTGHITSKYIEIVEEAETQ